MKTTAIPAKNKSAVEEEDGRIRRRKKKPLKPLKPHSFSFPTSNRFRPISVSSSKLGPEDKRRKGGRKRRRRCEGGSSKWDHNWVSSRLHNPSSYEDKVVVMLYNILGVENVSNHTDLYENIPPEFLDWELRKELICKEVSWYNAGILCFQEVERFNELENLLKMEGYRGAYKAHTGEAHDGCAIFWNEKMFTLLHEETIEFQLFSLRHNVSQLCVFEMNENHSLHTYRHKQERKHWSKTGNSLLGTYMCCSTPTAETSSSVRCTYFLTGLTSYSRNGGAFP